MNQIVKVIAPAKVNLHLDIGPLQNGGYHTATSILHAITLHDTLTMRFEDAQPGSGLSVHVFCQGAAGIEPPDVSSEENIASKAVVALAKALGRSEDETVSIDITKAIPYAAGLGGGSSDAAAALVGAASEWGVDSTSDTVLEVARSLGADVPFFLHGGCTCMTGRGDVFDHALVPMKKPLILVRPDAGVSTVEAYKEFDALDAKEESKTATAPYDIHEVQNAADIVLFNNLAPAAESLLPELARVREWLTNREGIEHDAQGNPAVLLSGSGSASFAVCESMDAAYAAVSAAKLEGWWARSCSFAPIAASVLDTSSASEADTNLGAAQKLW